MECSLARVLIAIGRRELSADDAALLDRHLATCPECANAERKLVSFDQAVGQVLRAVPVPASLHKELLKTAYAHRGAQMRKRIYQFAALAAAILLAFGIGTGLVWMNRPKLDTNELAAQTDHQQDYKEQTVQAWLEKQELPKKLPHEFNFNHYLFHGKEPLAGQDVPVIVFTRGTDVAKVYFVPKSQFKTQGINSAQGRYCKIDVHTNLHRDYVVLISYTTETLDPFLLRPAVLQVTSL